MSYPIIEKLVSVYQQKLDRLACDLFARSLVQDRLVELGDLSGQTDVRTLAKDAMAQVNQKYSREEVADRVLEIRKNHIDEVAAEAAASLQKGAAETFVEEFQAMNREAHSGNPPRGADRQFLLSVIHALIKQGKLTDFILREI